MDDAPGLIRLAPGVAVPVAALAWSQERSGGPGGQNVNRTASKVELRLRPESIQGLTWRACARLAAAAGSRMTDAGELVLTCDETRSAGRNREMLIERLAGLVRDAIPEPRVRRATRPSRASRERRLVAKAHRARRLQDRIGD